MEGEAGRGGQIPPGLLSPVSPVEDTAHFGASLLKKAVAPRTRGPKAQE